MPSIVQTEDEEVHALLRRKRRELALYATLSAGLLLAAAGAIWVVLLRPEPPQRLAPATGAIEARAAQYCRVRETLASRTGAEERPWAELPELRLPVDHDLGGREETPRARDPGTNADFLEQRELDQLCGAPVRDAQLFSGSFLGDLQVHQTSRSLSPAAVEGALEDLRALEWLLVFRPTRASESRMVGASEFVGGSLEARVWICRLEDASCPVAVDVHAQAPAAVSYVEVEGFESSRAAEAMLDAETHAAYRRAVGAALRDAGVRVRDPRGRFGH